MGVGILAVGIMGVGIMGATGKYHRSALGDDDEGSRAGKKVRAGHDGYINQTMVSRAPFVTVRDEATGPRTRAIPLADKSRRFCNRAVSKRVHAGALDV